MQFEGGPTATLQMVAFTEKICARQVRFYGTKVFLSPLQETFLSLIVTRYRHHCNKSSCPFLDSD